MKAIIFDLLNTLYDPSSNRLFDGVPSLLENLSKKYKMALVSSTPDEEGRRALVKALGIDKYFEKVIVDSKTPELFLSICKELEVKPEEVYVIGDSLESEICVGNELRMKTVWIGHDRVSSINSWTVVNSVSEVGDIVV